MVSENFEQILKDVRNKVLYPIYLLMGEETFYIDVIADYIEEQVLTETEKEFNLSIIYGKDTDIPTIVSTAKRYPMMSSHNLVIVREAHHIQNLDDLLPYLKQPLMSTILVICYKYKTLDKRTRFFKDLQQVGVVFHGKKLYDNQVPGWITRYVGKRGYKIGPRAVQMLADHLGTDLGKIVNEVKKLFINLEQGAEITTRVIEENIGISKDYNIFEFQQALGSRSREKAFRIARYFADNPKSTPIVMVTGLLYQYFSKILLYHSLKDKNQKHAAAELGVNPFFVKDYALAAQQFPPGKIISVFSLLRATDLKSKGMYNETATTADLLKELTYKILN